tara:strand:+ start:2023 stop:2202 length:180 start_codon:yes stop_codon:yes gene_type:complete
MDMFFTKPKLYSAAAPKKTTAAPKNTISAPKNTISAPKNTTSATKYGIFLGKGKLVVKV